MNEWVVFFISFEDKLKLLNLKNPIIKEEHSFLENCSFTNSL